MKGRRRQILTTATLIAGYDESNPTHANAGNVAYPASAVISNPTGGQTVYLGGPDVNTTDKGWPFAAGSDIEVDTVTDVLYGIVATTSQYVYLLARD